MNEYITLTSSQYKQLLSKSQTSEAILPKKTVIETTPPKKVEIETTPPKKSIMEDQENLERAKLNDEGIPLYEFLKKKSPSIDWNADYELMISGLIIPGSNIFDLIKDATSSEDVQKSDSGHFRIFKKWLQDNDVPDNLVNARTREKEKLPEITPPINLNEIPSIQSLRDQHSPSTEVVLQSNTKKRKKNYISQEPIRKSTREMKIPDRFKGRGLTKKKWLRI